MTCLSPSEKARQVHILVGRIFSYSCPPVLLLMVYAAMGMGRRMRQMWWFLRRQSGHSPFITNDMECVQNPSGRVKCGMCMSSRQNDF